jgi:hypothetical protein
MSHLQTTNELRRVKEKSFEAPASKKEPPKNMLTGTMAVQDTFYKVVPEPGMRQLFLCGRTIQLSLPKQMPVIVNKPSQSKHRQ